MSPSSTVAELERLYHEVVLQQDFYGKTYGFDWQPQPYEEMARLLAGVLAPRRHVDVGCGKGFLVSAMRRLGIESFGVDYSEALIAQSPADVRPYLRVASTEESIMDSTLARCDLITYMEVFEHLPISICEEVLKTLRIVFSGKLVITTPSFGLDERWAFGISTNDQTPTWRRDMAANRPFTQIVLKDGLPHHGHISLCSYRWWTEFFLFHGWNRARDLEGRAAQDFRPTIIRHNWNPYILEPLPPADLELAPLTDVRLGPGWHGPESFREGHEGRWTNGMGQVYLDFGASRIKAVAIELSAPDVNVIRDFNLTIIVEQQILQSDYQLLWIADAVSSPVRIEHRATPLCLEIPLLALEKAKVAEGSSFGGLRLSLLSPTFCPHDYKLSVDQRTLGLFIHKITVLVA